MKNKFLFALGLTSTLFLTSCGDDDIFPANENFEIPETYRFSRNGDSSVSYGGQTTRVSMAGELMSAMTNVESVTEQQLEDMFTNSNNPFTDATLNETSKSIQSKVAASNDYFASNNTRKLEVIQYFRDLFENQATVVKPNMNVGAIEGQAGQLGDGGKPRYVNEKGLENNQLFAKTLIGALLVDQALNNYLSPAVLDASTNITDNENEVVVENKNYTTMEHKWDEAFGYIYGKEANANDPTYKADSFLNKYIGKVDSDSDFEGIADNIYNAFKKGRAAIVAKNYKVRDEQAQIIRENVSKVIGVRAVHYLQSAKTALSETNIGSAAHNLSEGIGFVNSLEFTRKPNSDSPYLTATEVEQFNSEVDGLYTSTPEELDKWSEKIAKAFGFTVEQAAN